MLIREQLATALAKELPQGGKVIVACSGGCDSVVLLDAVAALPELTVVVWHLRHGLRPDDHREAELVTRLADERDCRVRIETVGLATLADEWGCGLEEAGHRYRRQRLREVQLAEHADAVLTAHHRDDQAETVLHNLLRGSGPLGEAGMPPRLECDGLVLLRPLLNCGRTELRAEAGRRELSWIEDPSNTDCQFQRNQLRHEVLPTWEEAVPGVAEALAALAMERQQEQEELENRLQPIWTAAQDDQLLPAASIPRAQRPRWHLWRKLVRELGWPCNRTSLHRIDQCWRGRIGGRLSLTGSTVWRTREGLQWEDQEPLGAVPVGTKGSWRRGQMQLVVAPELDVDDADLWSARLAATAITPPLVWREPTEGERWQALGSPGSRTVLRWLGDHGVAAPRRRTWPVLADMHGIIWIPGHTIAQRVRITNDEDVMIGLQISITE